MTELHHHSLQWGRAYSARRTSSGLTQVLDALVDFNGAGLIQPGGRELRLAYDARMAQTSMGPGLFSPEDQRGDAAIEPAPHATSMGPGLFSPEDLKPTAKMLGIDVPTSMGPGLFSPEDLRAVENKDVDKVTSMGPGLFSPEDGPTVSMIPASSRSDFNGAGLIQPGGHSSPAGCTVPTGELQWGRAYSARRTRCG